MRVPRTGLKRRRASWDDPAAGRITAAGVVVPSTLVLLASLCTVTVLPHGAEPSAVHLMSWGWTEENRPSWLLVLGPPVATAVIGAWMSHAATQLLLDADTTIGQIRLRTLWGPLTAVFFLWTAYGATWAQVGSALPPWLVAAAAAIGSGIALAGVLLVPRRSTGTTGTAGTAADSPQRRALPLTASQRVLWTSSTRRAHVLWAAVPLIAWQAWTVHTAAEAGRGFVVLAVAVVLLGPWRVVIDSTGIQARPLIARPSFTYSLDSIHHAEVLGVRPWADFGGWGLRLGLRRRHGIITAGGPALAVTLQSGRTFVVTVPDPDTAASLINGLKKRESADSTKR
ncbi:hypothetical protein GCM10022419_111450 [Nonomuraea rosea]|uniref:DUF1648 domain-containing protein n=1 Tax=Nonomuraea rosea TaxID=638574 RepID=A0ABP6ZGD6_9ACTN